VEGYKFKYKRKFFWKSYLVKGHKFEENQNKMVLYFPNGGLREVKNWNDCEIKLGVDWVAFTKTQIKREAGESD
tara:strand:+ start:3335 stop:3556 length:222 start_codon:yes stop_codon:yes gene_type:complete